MGQGEVRPALTTWKSRLYTLTTIIVTSPDHFAKKPSRASVEEFAGQKPKLQDVSYWIKKSWMEMKESTIKNTWRKIGLAASTTPGSEVVPDI